MKLNFEVQTPRSNIVILDMAGNISFDTVPIFRKAVYTLVNHHILLLILNMKDIRFVDSTGIGAIVAANRFIQKRGGALSLVVTGSHIIRLLQTTQLMKILNVYPSVDKAVEETLKFKSGMGDFSDGEQIDRFFQVEEKKAEMEIIQNPTTVPFREGENVEMETMDTANHELFFAELKKNDGRNQLLLFQSEKFKILNVHPGQRFFTYFNQEETAYECELVVAKAVDENVVFQYPRELLKIEKRNAVRVPCHIPVRFQVCDVLGEAKIFEGVIENISGTGISLATNHIVSRTDCMGLTFDLPTTRRTVSMIGKVVRFQKNGGTSTKLGVRFLLVSDHDLKEVETFIKLGCEKNIAYYNKI